MSKPWRAASLSTLVRWLRSSPLAVQRLLGSINTKFVELLPLAGSEAETVATLMKKYESTQPQLADIALVYLAGREGIDTIFTLDRRDFSIYRTSRQRSFRILPEM
jgi:predicted nucleic acid-binding protein